MDVDDAESATRERSEVRDVNQIDAGVAALREGEVRSESDVLCGDSMYTVSSGDGTTHEVGDARRTRLCGVAGREVASHGDNVPCVARDADELRGE